MPGASLHLVQRRLVEASLPHFPQNTQQKRSWATTDAPLPTHAVFLGATLQGD